MHRSWKNDPESVESDWAEFFSSVEKGTTPNEAVRMPKRTSKVRILFHLQEKLVNLWRFSLLVFHLAEVVKMLKKTTKVKEF